jgi:hypothetical protein
VVYTILFFLYPSTVTISVVYTKENNYINLCKLELGYVGFQVLTPVIMKRDIFWDITPKSTDVSEKHVASAFRLQV